jgi:hypothetical protein
MLENVGASAVQLTPSEAREISQTLSSITIQGARLPDAVQVYSDVEAPMKK